MACDNLRLSSCLYAPSFLSTYMVFLARGTVMFPVSLNFYGGSWQSLAVWSNILPGAEVAVLFSYHIG